MSREDRRKIWVKRPGASATLVKIANDALVDDVRDMIMNKYANSLGKTFDAPDLTISIAERDERQQERLLRPEEEMCKTIDIYYPGGQTINEALIIHAPQQRTPRLSQKALQHQEHNSAYHDLPLNNGSDRMTPMIVAIPPSIPQAAGSHGSRGSQNPTAASEHARSIAILNTGQLPFLPTLDGRQRHKEQRPRFQRQHTSSKTVVTHPNNTTLNPPGVSDIDSESSTYGVSTRPRVDSSASDAHHAVNRPPAHSPSLGPPAPEAPVTDSRGVVPPASSIDAAPRPNDSRKSRMGKPSSRSRQGLQNESPNPGPKPAELDLDASVPPINVLIVEDNHINSRVLQNMLKRLKVRWQTAVDGQIAVNKWKKGGFHLVLMDIQMPVMNGLEATMEIRRLEKVNGIGVFSSDEFAASKNGKGGVGDTDGQDGKQANASTDELHKGEGFFNSPTIIVALTASSLESDRHEALAAGCNDFLTKPVAAVWMEQKIKEWGCMQALIDYEGWRNWKGYAVKKETTFTEGANV